MKEALTKFDSTAHRILKSFHATLETQPPEIIYHYTNDVGLRGILETGQLWLTDIFNLNDPSELKHGLSHAVNILNGKAAKGPPESQVFAKRFADFQHDGIQQIAHCFVCSFSSDGDELGQWRAYADNGRGYALGFDARVLEKDFNKDNGSTFPVTYNDAVLMAIHREMIDSMFDLISLPQGQNLKAATVNAYLKELSVYLSINAVLAALTFKHEAYKNESEYRFLQLYRGDVLPPYVKRRSRSYELVKYRELDWKRFQAGALKRIVIGPAADRVKAARFAVDCLAQFDVRGVEVACSEIPYRAV